MRKAYCNMCGKEMDAWDVQEDFSIYTMIGYGSKHDGEHLRLDLCCDCMDKIIDACRISPVKDADTFRGISPEARTALAMST